MFSPGTLVYDVAALLITFKDMKAQNHFDLYCKILLQFWKFFWRILVVNIWNIWNINIWRTFVNFESFYILHHWNHHTGYMPFSKRALLLKICVLGCWSWSSKGSAWGPSESWMKGRRIPNLHFHLHYAICVRRREVGKLNTVDYTTNNCLSLILLF